MDLFLDEFYPEINLVRQLFYFLRQLLQARAPLL